MLRRLRRHVLQAVDGWSKTQDSLQRDPRFFVRFLNELCPAPFLQEIRRIAFRHAQFRVQGHYFLPLRFPRGINVSLERRRAEGRNIFPYAWLGQTLQNLPFVLNLLWSRNALLLFLNKGGDRFTPHFNEIGPSHLLDFMDCIATFGRTLNFVQKLREHLYRLAKPILKLDNHHSGSCGRTLKHCLHTSMFYPGARLLFRSPPRNNARYVIIGNLRKLQKRATAVAT